MRYCPDCGTPLVSRLQGTQQRPTCPACGFIHFADPKVAVAVVITSAEGVLLGRRLNEPGRGRWALPAGFVDRGEALEAAAAREAHEELHVEVVIDRLIGLYSAAGDPVILAVYAASITAGTPQAGDDLDAVGYFPANALPELAFARDEVIVRGTSPLS
ncbi:MAG TPA: NUDIX hydrolase [Chloroflexota bacterium]|jgi:ADP-ribose pyrophosphatase YjhB (NUDIX family)